MWQNAGEMRNKLHLGGGLLTASLTLLHAYGYPPALLGCSDRKHS
jgi:hypothetical protein